MNIDFQVGENVKTGIQSSGQFNRRRPRATQLLRHFLRMAVRVAASAHRVEASVGARP
ncbi:hypothetical protein [Burkholderia ubonensis]|uniref:hypothetical protein n=1 Tax=Burkholderia ubonensis TaxID=101571 RepID=UPI000A7D00A9|nr:hypothetical protein [Burkholderia ubonensis]